MFTDQNVEHMTLVCVQGSKTKKASKNGFVLWFPKSLSSKGL